MNRLVPPLLVLTGSLLLIFGVFAILAIGEAGLWWPPSNGVQIFGFSASSVALAAVSAGVLCLLGAVLAARRLGRSR